MSLNQRASLGCNMKNVTLHESASGGAIFMFLLTFLNFIANVLNLQELGVQLKMLLL